MGPVWAVLFLGALGGLVAELGVLVRWALAAPRVIGTHLHRPAYYLVGSLWVLGSGMLAAVVATGVMWPSALVGATFTILACWVLAQTLSPDVALGIGVVLVVSLGAVGLVLRGIGDELDSLRLRALGYYVCALAYAATASVALYNGLPQLLEM